MGVAILIFIMFIYSYFGAIRLKAAIELLMAPVLTLFCMVILIAGFCGDIRWGMYGILAACVPIGVWNVKWTLANKKDWRKKLLTPGMVFFCVSTGLLLSIHYNRILNVSYDEFSQWGLAVKNMWLLHILPNAEGSTVYLRDYPPYTALLQWMSMFLEGELREGNLYVCMDIFLVAFSAIALHRVSWQNKSRVFLLSVLLFLIPMSFNEKAYSMITVDTLLSIMFATSLYAYLTVENQVIRCIWVASALMALPLTKSTGSGLAAMVLVVIVVDLLCQYGRKLFDKGRGRELLLYIGAFALGKVPWEIWLEILGCRKTFATSAAVGNNRLFSVMLGQGSAEEQETVSNFFKALWDTQLGTNFSVSAAACLVLALAMCLLLRRHVVYRIHASAIWVVVGMFVIYMFGLINLYLNHFIEEGVAAALPSYGRYMAIYVLGLLLFLFLLLANEMKGLGFAGILVGMTLLFPQYWDSMERLCRLPSTYAGDYADIRQPYEKMLEIRDEKELSGKVAFVSQNYDGNTLFKGLVARYEMTPVECGTTDQLHYAAYSLGEPYGDADIYTKNMTGEEWLAEIYDYSYVYLFQIDAQFVEGYGYLFENQMDIRNDSLFWIDHDNGVLITVHNS